VIDVPCAVVPFHWPTLSDEEDGDVGALLHVEAGTAASVPTHNTAFVCAQIDTKPPGYSISVSHRSHAAGVFPPSNTRLHPAVIGQATRPGLYLAPGAGVVVRRGGYLPGDASELLQSPEVVYNSIRSTAIEAKVHAIKPRTSSWGHLWRRYPVGHDGRVRFVNDLARTIAIGRLSKL
jgi:hypothetical protein